MPLQVTCVCVCVSVLVFLCICACLYVRQSFLGEGFPTAHQCLKCQCPYRNSQHSTGACDRMMISQKKDTSLKSLQI